MRVISGERKGIALKAVPGKGTRPTTDKVKESIFNMLGQYFSQGVCLDLFAGSGGLGIEALSRGMEKAIFIDRDGQALATIKENLRVTKYEEQSDVFRNDYKQALRALKNREVQFDLVFLDPPYKDGTIEGIISYLDTNNMVKVNGFIVTEHHKSRPLQQEIGNFQQVKYENYGICSVQIYKKVENVK